MEFKEELEDLKERIARLERMAHPKRAFVRCEKCNKTIKEDGKEYRNSLL